MKNKILKATEVIQVIRLIGLTMALLFVCQTIFANDKPNVIIILADDLGIGDVSCYGSKMINTPNIDRLADEGLLFTRYHSAGSTCTPTRYSMLTGRYPYRSEQIKTGNLTGDLMIDINRFTLGELFKENGYATAAIGKWHLGYGDNGEPDWNGKLSPGPNELGFDYHWGVPRNGNDNVRAYVENDMLFGLDPNSTFEMANWDKKRVEGLLHEREDDMVNALLTERTLSFIRENKDNPFFVYFAPTIAHTHITPYSKFRGTSKAGQYGDFVQELDYYVGNIMNLLRELGIDENTIVVFTSDNGGQLRDTASAGLGLNLADQSQDVEIKARTAKTDAREMGHKTNLDLRKGKSSPYQGGFNVPCIIRWKGKIPEGNTSDRFICSADYLATFADFFDTNIPMGSGGDSYSWVDMLNGDKVKEQRSNAVLRSKKALSFIDGNWKLIDYSYGVKPQDLYELYNLKDDPSELEDLSMDNPEKLNVLRRKLAEILEKQS